jgi:acyl-CoA thioester hydrolase
MNRPANDTASHAAVPFRSRVMHVESSWIDYNGHLNMAYYNVLFDRCVDEAFDSLGLGPDYVRTCDASFFTAETHLCYLRELHEGAPVRATYRLLDYDARRAHGFQELYHAEDGWLSATCELMTLHVDTAQKRVSPWPDEVMARLAAMKTAHDGLDIPPQVGRVIGIRRPT